MFHADTYDPKFVAFANDFAIRALMIIGKFPGKNKEALMALGELTYSVSYALDDDDVKALTFLNDVVDASTNEAGAFLRHLMQQDPSARTEMSSAGAWADQAFPQIVVGHKFAAAMAATVVRDPYVIANIRPPFRAFLIEVPSGLFPIGAWNERMESLPGKFEYITRILVRYGYNSRSPTGFAWHMNFFTSGYSQLWRIGDTKLFIDGEVEMLGPTDNSYALPVEDVDQRSLLLASRLMLNVCLAFSDPSAVKAVGRAKSGSGYRPKGERIPPQTRVFQVGKPVSVDARQEIHEFAMHGQSRVPTVQTLVRGHWKPVLGARLGHPVWIEPYWRGPEGAPILVRPRTLKDLA